MWGGSSRDAIICAGEEAAKAVNGNGSGDEPVPEFGDVLQLKIGLLQVSPMIWRRFLVPSSFTLRQVHGVIQVGMGWEGIHLFQFCLRAAHYGSFDLCVDSPNIPLAELQLRKSTRFLYEYDLNIPWCHEIRVENKLGAEPGKFYPRCVGGEGHRPPEDCAGPAGFMDNRNSMASMASWEDLRTMVEIAREVLLEERPEVLDDEERRWVLEGALERYRAREIAQGKPFSRRAVNADLRRGEHLELMHQRYGGSRTL